MRYDHKKIEKKWQKKWKSSNLYKTKDDPKKKKSYVLDMFPYPSGEGLHVGHPKGYIATDVYSRLKRMQGFNTLHPMGWDAFGLPAENFAIKNKIHPRKAVEKNIKRFKEQLAMLGFNYDWSREINTTDPAYYKWTQWIFLQLYKKGLAYQSNEPINWCPSCQTGLSNEDLDGGLCERCGSQVEKRSMRQWVLRITRYADRLLNDLELLPKWPEHIKEAQRNWIGRSEGALVSFSLTDVPGQTSGTHQVEVFTTRPDTMFGATFVAISPELAQKWIEVGWQASKEVHEYVQKALADRITQGVKGVQEKTGIHAGISAINPANQEKIPVWVANYVLGDVGTGAIMAVPAHDERDFEFAKKYQLPIVQVVKPVYVDKINPVREGVKNTKRSIVIIAVKHWEKDLYLMNASEKYKWKILFTGGIEEGEDPVETAKREIREESGYKNFRSGRVLDFVHKDVFYAPHKGVNREVDVTNVLLELENGEMGEITEEEQALHQVSWKTREEMIQEISHDNHRFVFRYATEGGRPNDWSGTLIHSGAFDGMTSDQAKKKITDHVGGVWTTTYRIKDWVFSRQRYWGEPIPIIHCAACGVVPVPDKDLPVKLPEVKNYAPTGTGESPLAAIEKWVNVACPHCKGRAKRETNTMPQWAGSSWYWLRFMDPKNKKSFVDKKKERYWKPVDVYVGGDHAVRHLIYARFWHKFLYDLHLVSGKEPFTRLEFLGFILAEDGRKMSKRWGNIIRPDDIVKTWGADTLRLYEMFMGPFTDAIAWNTNNMIGVRRFLERVWTLRESVSAKDNRDLDAVLHRTIKKVGEDIEAFKFNTAVSQMMVFVNEAHGKVVGRAQWEMFLKILAPFAPHSTEELWTQLGYKKSIHRESWPKYSARKIKVAVTTIAVQVNGKVRGEVSLAPDAPKDDACAAGRLAVLKWLENKEEKNVIYVPGKILNFVIGE